MNAVGQKKKKKRLRAEVVEGMGEELGGRVWVGRLDRNIIYANIRFSNNKDKPTKCFRLIEIKKVLSSIISNFI